MRRIDVMRARVETEIALLEGDLRSGGVPALLAAIRQRAEGENALDYLVQDVKGKRIGGQLPTVGNRTGWLGLDVREHRGEPPERERVLVVALPNGWRLGAGDDRGLLGDLRQAIIRALALGGGLVVLFGIGGGILLSRAFLGRLDSMSRAAEAIIEGDVTSRIPLRGTNDDLDRLSATFNRMLDRIAALVEGMRQISTDIAHDLRTPLAHLLQELDVARSHALSTEDYRCAIAGAMSEAEAILKTFAALLRISEIEAHSARSRLRNVDLTSLVESIVEAFTPAAEDSGHKLKARLSRGISLRGDKELLTQLLVNLVENALRHTPSGTSVTLVLLDVEPIGVRLVVEDDGPGVAFAERAYILRRFYRCERSRTTPGNGLGLSLVAAVANLHGATISIEDAVPGLRIVITFPSDSVATSKEELTTRILHSSTRR